ncbi:ABC family B (MDR/TAP),protein [Rhizoctonia solani AG-3 Rhs1AP]|uniref:ABC family B (MDR/TAP),protein n=1 Tax=Rhizoctonia solani AG-3 Rhs1AP TaxID=1086054 RepID=X8JGP5_9AGAM|nr:ABC family B (MDR/TAP),protein [Rhizoctonia solani AG-3 Rhs1AP]
MSGTSELKTADPLANTTRPTKYKGPAYFYLFTYADRSDKILYAIGTMTAIVSGAILPVLDLVYGTWTTAVVGGGSNSEVRRTTSTVAGACLGIGVLQFIMSAAFVCCFSIASARVTDRLRRAYLNSVIHQDAEFFENVGPGEVGTRMIKDIASVRAAVGEKLSIFIWSLSTVIVAIIVSFCQAPRVTGVVFSLIPFTFIILTLIDHLSSRAESQLLVVDGQANTLLDQILGSIRVVQSFAAETFLAEKYDMYLQRLQRLGKWRSLVRGLESGMANFVMGLVYSLTFWYGSRLIVSEGLGVGSVLTIFWSMITGIYSFVGVLPHILAIKDSATISAQLLRDIERIPKIDICRTDGAQLWSHEKVNVDIELRNVTFSYPSRPDHHSLDEVNMVLEGGKVTALVGESGSGKSTIAALLMRYYDPSDGQLLLSGHDIRSLNLTWLRSQISVVSQEPQLFTASIFENVAYGLTGTPHELPSDPSEAQLQDARNRIERALKQAQAWDFVCNLPEGMDTRVSSAKTGVLSGGQRQRIAAARALVRRPRILLLDEGTSALDSETEQKLMKAIHEEQEETGMTTILIAHRLSSIQNADRIIAMRTGKVVEQGTYQELMSLGGIFSTLVRNQTPATLAIGQKSKSFHEQCVTPTTSSNLSQLVQSRPESQASTIVVAPESLERGEATEEKSPAGFLGRFIKMLGRYPLWIVGGIVGGIAVCVCFSVKCFVLRTLSVRDDDSRLLRETRKWSFWFLILAITNLGTSFISGFLLSAGADRIDRRLRLVSLVSLLKQEVGYFENQGNTSGALTASVAAHVNNVATNIGLVWQQLISSTVILVGGLVLGFVLSWKLTLLSMLPLPFIFAAAYYNIMFIEGHERQVQKPLEEASAFASEHVDAIQTVAALGREEAIMRQFHKSASEHVVKSKNLAIGAIGFGVGNGSILFLSAIIMWWGTTLYTRGQITLEQLYSSFEANILAGYAASRIFTYIPDWARMVHGFRSICEWEDRQPEVDRLKSTRLLAPGCKMLEKVKGELVFNSCTLKYASRPEPAVSDVSFIIKPGQSVAFCGPSGGGKSSIILMISRFYDPTTGTISLDGRDIRSIPLEEYRSHLALVSQDAVLYEGTFRENLTLGETSVTQDQLERACRDASVLEFIQSLPEGFDTSVGLKGSQMSGGQRQRLCIARALLRNPKILLLITHIIVSTQALDAESEKSVKQALEQASKGRTTISIAHRLSTIQGADVIHVVEEGRIVESGSHAELLALNGRYVNVS